MAYPGNTDVANAAATFGADPIEVYAFAAVHSRLPASNAELIDFASSVTGSGNWGISGDPVALRYGYLQSHGAFPPEGYFYVTWGAQNGYLFQVGQTWESTGLVPQPGAGYPPGNAPTTDTTTPTAPASPTAPTYPTYPTAPPAPSGPNLAELLHNPIILIGGALFLAYAFGLFPRK